MPEIDLLSWLPAQSQRMLAEEQRKDDSRDREEGRARAARHEEMANRAIASAISEATARGEYVSPVDAINGRVGRTVEQVLLGAQGEVADRVPKPLRPPPDAVWLGAAEPTILPGSPVKRSIAARARHWMEWQQKKREAEEAERRTRDDFPLSRPVTLRSQPTASLESRSVRAGGPEPGFGRPTFRGARWPHGSRRGGGHDHPGERLRSDRPGPAPAPRRSDGRSPVSANPGGPCRCGRYSATGGRPGRR